MGTEVWFIARNWAGRREILTGDYDEYKDAMAAWTDMISTEPCIEICKTVYG